MCEADCCHDLLNRFSIVGLVLVVVAVGRVNKELKAFWKCRKGKALYILNRDLSLYIKFFANSQRYSSLFDVVERIGGDNDNSRLGFLLRVYFLELLGQEYFFVYVDFGKFLWRKFNNVLEHGTKKFCFLFFFVREFRIKIKNFKKLF